MHKIKKSLSQHFLIDKNVRNKIIKLTNIKNKKILEVGPGKGFLTDAIIEENPKKLILIEKDRVLFEKLLIKYKDNKKITIYNYDFIKCNIKQFNKYTIITNLPYNISSKFLQKIFYNNHIIKETIMMIQKEVAMKIDPSQKKMNKYKFLLNLTSKFEHCFNVSPNVFFPKPKVQSSVVKIKSKNKKIDTLKLDNFIKILFNNKRKMVSNLIKIKSKNNYFSKRIEDLKFDELKQILNFF